MTNELKHIVCIEGKRNVDKLSDNKLSDNNDKVKPQRSRAM
jgi:hypothetical protein